MEEQNQQMTYSAGSGDPLAAPTPIPDVSSEIAAVRAELERYRGMYAGSQRSLTETQKRAKELEEKAASLESMLASLQAEREALASDSTQKIADLSKQLEALASEKARYEKERGVRKRVALEYPELVQFYEQGLMVGIEALDDSDLGNYLQRFKATLTSLRQTAAIQAIEGASPPAPSVQKPATMTSNELLERLMSTPVSAPEYNDLMQAYLNSLSKL